MCSTISVMRSMICEQAFNLGQVGRQAERQRTAMKATVAITRLVDLGKIDAQRIEIFLNDIYRLFSIHPSRGANCNFALSAAAVRKRNVLTLKLPDAISPVSVGINTDVRRLAIRVNWIEFAAA